MSSSVATSPRYAYVALLMKGNGYLPGVKALFASLRATGTKHDLVLLVTPDVKKTAVQPYVDHVVEVPYLTYRTKPMKTAKQREMYTVWSDVSYTKWQTLSLVQYSKVLLLDLDVVVLRNLDHLFELPCPAATFSNAWAQPYTGKGGLYHPYTGVKHGEQVPPSALQKGLERSFVLIGTTVLLQPSVTDLQTYQDFLSCNEPYGKEGCHSMFDEQSLTEFYSTVLQRPWYHISQAYNMIPWHAKSWLPPGETAAISHFFGEKPWNMPRGKWSDLEVWWRYHDLAQS